MGNLGSFSAVGQPSAVSVCRCSHVVIQPFVVPCLWRLQAGQSRPSAVWPGRGAAHVSFSSGPAQMGRGPGRERVSLASEAAISPPLPPPPVLREPGRPQSVSRHCPPRCLGRRRAASQPERPISADAVSHCRDLGRSTALPRPSDIS